MNNNENIVALAKLVNEKSVQYIAARKATAVGRHEVDFTVRVQGSINVNADTDKAPTVSIPLLETLALTLRYCGITREHAKALLTKILRQAIAANGMGQGALMETLPWITEMIEEIKRDIIAELPRTAVSGAVRTSLTFTEVAELVAA
jgi:hypothetical protein